MGSRKSSPAFSLNVDGVKGVFPAGEKYTKEMIAEGKIPVLFLRRAVHTRRDCQACRKHRVRGRALCPHLLRGDVPGPSFDEVKS